MKKAIIIESMLIMSDDDDDEDEDDIDVAMDIELVVGDAETAAEVMSLIMLSILNQQRRVDVLRLASRLQRFQQHHSEDNDFNTHAIYIYDTTDIVSLPTTSMFCAPSTNIAEVGPLASFGPR